MILRGRFCHLEDFLLRLVARLGRLFNGRVGPLGAVLVLRVELVLLEVCGLLLLQIVAVVALVLRVLWLLQVGLGLLVLMRYNFLKQLARLPGIGLVCPGLRLFLDELGLRLLAHDHGLLKLKLVFLS